jgi:hypothetical protein
LHPNHLQLVNAGYKPRAIEVAEAQLDYALGALEKTRGPAATRWVQRIHELVGRIYLSELGGSIVDAKKLLRNSRMFNFEFRSRTNEYTSGKISLSDYKAWLMPMTFLYLKLPDEHPANEVKHLLAEYSSDLCDMTEDELKAGISKIIINRIKDLN